jgi:mannose-6-phosphate isomerase
MAIYTLINTIQKYAWGDRHIMPDFMRKANPDNEPWAELWMGAHPKAPSRVVRWPPASDEPGLSTLDALIAADPISMLGQETVRCFDGKLPFLFKLLAAGMPLSIQAHPARAKARRGYEKEQETSIPLDASERNYKDPNHKPETIIALSRFEGLCGFRPIDEIVTNIKLVAGQHWRHYAGRLADDPGKLELSVLFYNMISAKDDTKARILRTTLHRAERIIKDEPPASTNARTFGWIKRLMDIYPDDIGAVAPLMLNLFDLRPGQALFLGPGEPHAYLGGFGAEIMANSDNVLRGGLTSKYVDVPEFISVLGYDSHSIEVLEAIPGEDGFMNYPDRCADFSIARATINNSLESGARPDAPEILLCTSGELQIDAAEQHHSGRLAMLRGDSVFVPANVPAYRITGNGDVFRASLPHGIASKHA